MAAALVGGAFLSASLQVLFDRLASPAILNLIQGKRLDKKLLDRLQTTLYAASAVLDDAENRQIKNQAVKSWLDDLRDAVYHADDLFDEISTNVATQKEVRNLFPGLLNSPYRELGNKIKDITERLESVVQYKDVLGLREKERENLSWRRPQTTSLVEESNVYGRNKDKDSVIKFLLDDKEERTLCVIPIVGMGGIGKTTLTQLVYNDDKVKKEFDLRVWVYVSQEFDILRITETILEAINPNGCIRQDLDSLQLELKENLHGKKFLIVLDDVWTENYIDWDHLQSPFLHGNKGSKILLTTRSQKVASIVQTAPTHAYDVGLLSDEDSWLLFAKHAFVSANCNVNSNLKKIARDIVKKCKGLPLALKALGGLLRSKHDIRYWNLILNSEIWDLPEDECKIFPALRISYQYLPSQLKQCFAYCSLFPKGYEFDKEGLILLWMAEGFLKPLNKAMDLEEVGSVSFDDLTSRSFFLQSRLDGYFIMHDLMHDLATFVAGDFYHRLEAGNITKIPKRVRHLSYNACYGTLEDIEALCHVESGCLRTLLIDCFSYNNKLRAAHVDRLLLKFKRLRVLSLPGFWDEVLPDSPCQLKHLRYLNLTWSRIKRLPESIGNLHNLQTLKLRHTRNLCELPKSMQHLVNLRHLNIEGRRMELPEGIHKLQYLHYLLNFRVSKSEGAKIRELRGLSNIGKRLQISYLEDVSSSMEALEARMRDKKSIEHLELYWSIDADDAADSEAERDILDKLLPLSNLKILWITGYRGTRFSDWLEHPWAHNIVDLSLMVCRNCCVLPPLGQLSSLRKLIIGNFDSLVTVGVEFYKASHSSLITPFASLEYLEFFDMPAWKEWCLIEMEAFPKLRYLIISRCSQLTRCMIQCPALETLDIVDCPVLVECCIPVSVNELVIRHCGSLKFPEHQCYKSLEFLDIAYSCDLLTSFTPSTFPNLKRLGIIGAYESLKCFPGNGLLPPTLSFISLRELSSLETLDWEAFRHLTSLQQLTIEDSPKLEKTAVERLAASMTMSGCPLIVAEELQHVSNVAVSNKLIRADRTLMPTNRKKPKKDVVQYERVDYSSCVIYSSSIYRRFEHGQGETWGCLFY